MEGKDSAMLKKAPPWGELAPVRATERGLQFLRLIVITPLRLDKLGTSPQGEAFLLPKLLAPPLVAYGDSSPKGEPR